MSAELPGRDPTASSGRPIEALPTLAAATQVELENGRSAVDKTAANNPNAGRVTPGGMGGMPGDLGVGEIAPPPIAAARRLPPRSLAARPPSPLPPARTSIG